MSSSRLIRKIPIILIGAVICFGMVSGSFAETYYVDPQTGNINNDGSSNSPWSTLQDVFSSKKINTAVAPGDTLLLRSGYHGAVSRTGLVNSDYKTIKAQSGHTPTLSRLILLNSAKWRIDGLTISPEFDATYPAGNIVQLSSSSTPSSDMIIENCTIYSMDDSSNWTANDWATLTRNGIYTSNVTNVTIRNNNIKNVWYGVVVNGNGITVSNNTINGFVDDGINTGGSNILIEYNVIKNLYDVTDAHNDGIQFYAGGTDPHDNVILRNNRIIQYDPSRTDSFKGGLQGLGCFDGPNTNWVVENNVLIVDHYHGITIFAAQNVKVINNTVGDPLPGNSTIPAISIQDNSERGGACESGLVRNNLAPRFNSTSSNPSIIEDHNLVVTTPDVIYEDWSNFNVRLKPDTPAVDGGSSELAPDVDIEGTSRSYGSAPDIGAYEYQSEGFSLSQNYPNPFNHQTFINYHIPSEAMSGSGTSVQINIYNLLGQRVKLLLNKIQAPGEHTIIWNGHDEGDREVATGLYLYQLTVGKSRVSKIMIYIK